MAELPQHLVETLSDRYRVEREIGQGGMATVYLAQDVRHDRKVALKVLRPELAAILGAERFLHEIKTTAHLQHPHILPLHDSGEVDGHVFYVMPYVEGESLRDRLNREAQLPVDEAIRITCEIASALDYAHRHGVIHRDIKPENVLLHDGQALVADFGIALAASRSEGGDRMTETGMSLGTPHYMSPEQAMGQREITARSDVYALGCVAYEMLTGDPPFTGSTPQAIVARVLTELPRGMTLQRHTVSPAVEAAILKALEKLPADRFASAAEFAQALVSPAGATSAMPATGVGASARLAPRSIRMMVAVALGAAVLGGIASRIFLPPDAGNSGRPVRFDFAAPLSSNVTYGPVLDIGPTTEELVFVGSDNLGVSQLYRRPLDATAAVPIPGATGTLLMFPTVSPDGDEVAYYSSQKLVVVPIGGGAVRSLAPMAPRSYGVSWGDDGSIVYSPSAGEPLFVVSATGGAPRTLTTLSPGVADHRWPQVLPGSRFVLFTVWRGQPATARLAVASMRTGEVQELPEGAFGRFGGGNVVFGTMAGGLRSVPFDPSAGQVRGTPVVLDLSVATRSDGSINFALSRAGTIAFTSADRRAMKAVLVDRNGASTPLQLMSGQFQSPRLSPDGRQLVVAPPSGTNTRASVWLHDFRLGTFGPIVDDGFYPVWSRDGRRIYFSRDVDADVQVFSVPVDRSEEERAELQVRGQYRIQDVSPDGRHLLLRVNQLLDSTKVAGLSQYDLWAFSLDSARTLTRWLVSDALERSPAFSPDGRWVAYSSDETGRDEIYVRPFPGPGGRTQVSSEGGTEPAWVPGGNELLFRNSDRFESVAVTLQPAFRVLSRPRTLFRGEFFAYPWQRQYDVYPDGRRLVALQLEDVELRITVVTDWMKGPAARAERR